MLHGEGCQELSRLRELVASHDAATLEDVPEDVHRLAGQIVATVSLIIKNLKVLHYKLTNKKNVSATAATAEGEPPNVEETVEGQTHAGSPQEDVEADVDAERDEA
jgi:hypothetical protein